MKKMFLLVSCDQRNVRIGMTLPASPREEKFQHTVKRRCDKPNQGLKLEYAFGNCAVVSGPENMIHHKAAVMRVKDYSTVIMDDKGFARFQADLFKNETKHRRTLS